MAKRGRPKKPSTEDRKRRSIRFSDEEWERVGELADRANTTKSNYVRSTIFNYDLRSVIDKKSLFELAKIGTNVNQIAKVANSTGEIKQEDLKAIRKALEELSLEIIQKG